MTGIPPALLAALMHSTAPMVLSDPHQPDMPLVAINQAFIALSGYPREAMLGRNCRFLQGKATDPASAQRIHASIAAEQGCIEWIVNHRADGSQFWNLLFISPVRDPSGRLLFFFGNQLDITVGFPQWLPEVQLGRANPTPALQSEFHLLLTASEDAAATLARTTAAARRLAELSVKLQPGVLG